jgi:LuxR family transcriptional regulator, maltose regulon positive regulatory protein
MQRTIPLVEGGRLYHSEIANPIVVGTPAWYDWLEQHTSFLFVDRDSIFTARKRDTDPSDLAWEAYRTLQGKRYRVQLGPSYTLTFSRLLAAAWSIAGEHPTAEPTETSVSQVVAPASISPVAGAVVHASSPSSLMRTKLYRPRVNGDVIPRVRLIERLNAGLDGKLTLVSAPAGFGKTTLLVAWLQTLDRSTAWLSLDENDNELALFVHALTTALQTIFPDAFQAAASLLTAPQFPPAEHVATLLSNELADVPLDMILVLDDYHLIRNSEVHTLLDVLIEHLPPQLHLVLATRSDPPLPLARWRAQGHLHELRGVDLRFTLEETEAFLMRVLDNEVAHETVLALEERTEGWIAVLRLAALSLRSASDRMAFMERLRHYPDRSISSYLLEEILTQQAPAVQELLVRTAMLEQFCAGLCAAIMGSDYSHGQVQATLDRLEGANLFLVPLDERQGWYRFHPLFKGLLQQRLQAHSSQAELATLHRRASAWYAGQGLVEEAIEHALAAGDMSDATSLVEAQFLWAFEQEQWGQLERWLRLLPEDQIHGSPSLLVARVWIAQAHGQLKDFPRLLRAAEQLVSTSGSGARDLDDPKHRLLRALIALLWSQYQFRTGQAQASLESARSALEWLPPGEQYVASYAKQWLAASNQATGHEDVALVALQQALRDHSTHLTSTARLLFAQAWVYLAAGKLPQLEQTARHLLRVAEQADLTLSQNYAHWWLGVVYYEWNNLDAAVYHFSVVIANRHHASFWAVQEALCVLAVAYQAQGLGKEAQETARSLLELVQGAHNMRQLITAYAFQGHLALLQDEVEKASQWLELAGEQEVAGPMMFFEDPPITKAWMLLAKGDEPSVAHGQALLIQLLQHVEAMHSTRKTIKVLALQAWAYDLQGRETEALEVLERALDLGRPGGFIRTFAEVPPLARRLQELRKRRKTLQEVDSKLDAYLQRILAAMSPMAAQASSNEELLRQEGLEPLTERELQILRLLDKDLTNKEIARELVVTPGTVKVHTTNLYRKLSVTNRRAAVTLSKALGLLASDHAVMPVLHQSST